MYLIIHTEKFILFSCYTRHVKRMDIFTNAKCTSNARLDGKTTIITGCNTGIGKATALDFYKRGARVIMACRTVAKAEEAAECIRKSCKSEQNVGEIVIKELKLDSLKSVRKCAEELLEEEEKINILVNNAGIFSTPKGKTEDGFELQIGTNHFGHFLFTLLLLPKILMSTPARILNLSSSVHFGTINFDDVNWERRSYSPFRAYAQSKLANILFSKELARRLEGRGITVYCVHPGAVHTDAGRYMSKSMFPGMSSFQKFFSKLFFKTPMQGAQTTIYCAVDEKTANETGLYYAECKVKAPSRNACDAEAAKKLWDLSIEMVGLQNCDPFQA